MAFTSTLVFTLFLFFIPVREIKCDLLNTTVSSSGVVITWERQNEWTIVGVYRVQVMWGDLPICNKIHTCFSDTCIFDSDTCLIKALPCSSLTVIVEGGGHREETVVTTAPSPVKELKVHTGLGKRTISWESLNSKCLQKYIANVTFSDYYHYLEELEPSETSISLPICMRGKGYVEVKAIGGSGGSENVGVEIKGATRDSVDIPSCSPIGCRNLDVNWKYKAVCPDVSYLRVDLIFGHINTTIIELDGGDEEGEISYENLEIDTRYNTCISTWNEEDELLARKCVFCEVEPEAVRYLRAADITNHTATLKWSWPTCPKPLPVSFDVYHDHLHNITTKTQFTIQDLDADKTYEVCVRVHHDWGLSSRTSQCIQVSTLPNALEYVRAKVYQENSLFITWPSDPLVNKYKYRLSWNDSTSEHLENTVYSSYTIEGYNTTNDIEEVCVEVEVIEDGRISVKTCTQRPFPNFHKGRPDKTNMIVSVCVSAALAIVVSVVLVVVAVKEAKNKS